MNLDKRRLIDAIVRSTRRIASRFDIPGADMDHMAAMTAVGELVRRDDPARLHTLYGAGYALAEHLAGLVERHDANAIEGAEFRQLPPVDEGNGNFTVAQARLHALRKCLSSLVTRSGYPVDPEGNLQDIIPLVCQWEGDVIKAPSYSETREQEAKDFQQMIEHSARAQGGAFEDAKMVNSTTLIGGFSNVTTLFTLADKMGRTWDLVARASTGLPIGIEGRDIDGEYYLLRYLYQNGAAVAEPVWLERDVERFGTQFLVTQKLNGKNFGTVVEAQRLSSPQICALAAQLAKIHALPLDATHPDLQQSLIDTRLIGVSSSEAVSNYIDRWAKLWRSTGLASPTIEVALHWLRANLIETDDAPVLVHGDYALHNIMMLGDEISGVLDWELSHLGDRAEDIAGLLASFSHQEDAGAFMRHYIEAGGKPVTDFQIEYFNVFRYFIMYVVMLESELRFYSLPEVHPELLVLGSFVQLPAQRMAEAIASAEKAKARR